MIHEQGPFLHALGDDDAGDQSAVGVERLDPVIVDQTSLGRIDFRHPDNRSATRQRQHQQIIRIGRVDAPFLVRGDEIQDDMLLILCLIDHRLDGLGIDRRTIDGKSLAKGSHPAVILIELLPSGQRAPGNELMHIGIAGIIADMLALDPRPSRRGNDLARLCLQIAETDFFIFLWQGEMLVFASGVLRQGVPGLDRHFAIGFRCQHQDYFGRIYRAFDPGMALGLADVLDGTVELFQQLHFMICVPVDALAAIAQLFQQRTERTEALVEAWIIPLDDRNVGHGNSGHGLGIALAPIVDIERLRHFAGCVMQDRRQHDVLFNAQNFRSYFGEFLGDALVDFPIGLRLPHRVHRC